MPTAMLEMNLESHSFNLCFSGLNYFNVYYWATVFSLDVEDLNFPF